MPPAQDQDIESISGALRRLNLLPSNRELILTQIYRGPGYGLFSAELDEDRAYIKKALPGAANDPRPPEKRVLCEKIYHQACGEAQPEIGFGFLGSDQELALARHGQAPTLLPGRAPKVLGLDQETAVLVLEHLDPKLFHPWAMDLSDGRIDLVAANDVGRRLGGIHSNTAHGEELAEQLNSPDDFRALCLERHLLSAAPRHEDRAEALQALANMVLENRLCLVQGALDPGLVLLGSGGPIFMGGDWAWYGDPAWDLAYLLSRLLFLGLSRRWAAAKLMEGVGEMVTAYLDQVDWEPKADLQFRTSQLVGGLLLCGLDGRDELAGPGDEAAKERARFMARKLLKRKRAGLERVQADWLKVLKEKNGDLNKE
jgi:hypothetical protein